MRTISLPKRLIAASADPELALCWAMTFVDDTALVCGLEDGVVVRVKS